MKLGELLSGIVIEETNAGLGEETARVVSDSRLVREGDVFVCVQGTKSNGHDFMAEAIEKGASAVIIGEGAPPSGGTKYVRVADTRKALSFMHSNYNGRPGGRIKLIAVTGTNGKTTTVCMLRSILDRAGFRTAAIGTLTGAMTTPDPEELYARLKSCAADGVQYLIMEASSHALALEKLAPLRFAAGIFTNLTPEHLDFHGTLESYRMAKAKLFGQCALGLFNYDDPEVRRTASGDGCGHPPLPHRFYSAAASGTDFWAQDIQKRGFGGIAYTFRAPGERFEVSCRIPGDFTVLNTLAAASCAYSLGIPTAAIAGALADMEGVPGRLERVRLRRQDVAVFIDYAHTPDALENVLSTLRSAMPEDGRLTVLFGCGGDRDRTKRPVMGRIASRLADYVVVTGDNSRSEDTGDIIREILKGIDKERPYSVIPDRREAILDTMANARPGDVILLAGKGHEDYEITREGKRHFSEKEILRETEEKLYEQ